MLKLIIVVSTLLALRLVYELVYWFSKPKTYRTVEKTRYSNGDVYK